MLSAEGILLARYVPDATYDGMTIAEIAGIRESDPETTLMDLLKAEIDDDGRSSGSQILAFAMDEPDIESIMAWPHTVIGSDGELAGVHPRGYGTFARYLGHYVRDRNVVSLEEGVRRITSLAASQVGLTDRGLIQVGAYADLVLFDPDIIQDRATPEDPHIPSLGIDKVWVNGQLVYADGESTGNRPGRPIRRTNL
jgi:N-acyl-D-amino-acid deacylase